MDSTEQILLALAALFFPLLGLWVRFRNWKRIAHWLPLREAGKARLFHKKGIPVGDWGWPFLRVYHGGEGHILTVAAPGGGKSSTGSIPSCLSPTIRSRFIADPGGEITTVCIGEWRRKCRDVYVVNPHGLYREDPWNLPQHGFDPMKMIDLDAENAMEVTQHLAAALVVPHESDEGATRYFKSQGGEKLQAYIVFGAVHGMSLGEVAELMTLPIDSGFKADGITCQLDLWEEMQKIDILDGLLVKVAVDLIDKYANSPGEFQGVFSTMKDAFKFLNEPAIRKVFSKNDIDWDALRRGDAVVSIVMQAASWQLYSGLVKLAFVCLMRTIDQEKPPAHDIHILLEEFPALGRLAFFSTLAATARKKKGRIEIVIQNLGQIESAYPDWKAMLPLFVVRRYKSVVDGQTARAISDLLGDVFRTDSGLPRWGKLMTPDEILAMPKDRQIVYLSNLRPAYLGQYPFWSRIGERMKAFRNPNYPDYPKPEQSAFVRSMAGRFLLMWEWIIRPSPHLIMASLAVFIWAANPVVLIEQTAAVRGGKICKWLSKRGVHERTYPWGSRYSCGKLGLFGVVVL